MSGSLNKVTLTGNLGADPEFRSLGDGAEVASLRVATSERWKDRSSGEQKEKTEWHNVSVFGDGLVNLVRSFLKKGSKVYIEGKLETRQYEKDGQTRYSTEIVLRGFNAQLLMLDGKNDGAGGGNSGGNYGNQRSNAPQGGGRAPAPAAADDGFMDDDVPF